MLTEQEFCWLFKDNFGKYLRKIFIGKNFKSILKKPANLTLKPQYKKKPGVDIYIA